jgi:hypothetical protein
VRILTLSRENAAQAEVPKLDVIVGIEEHIARL